MTKIRRVATDQWSPPDCVCGRHRQSEGSFCDDSCTDVGAKKYSGSAVRAILVAGFQPPGASFRVSPLTSRHLHSSAAGSPRYQKCVSGTFATLFASTSVPHSFINFSTTCFNPFDSLRSRPKNWLFLISMYSQINFGVSIFKAEGFIAISPGLSEATTRD